MEINVYYKNVYGTDYCYPACDDAKIFVRQTQPLPMTVLAIYPRLNTFDK